MKPAKNSVNCSAKSTTDLSCRKKKENKMAYAKKNREVSIVHFSFFDLLFGAFGAFVFLMIVQVISTLNMVDLDIQKLVDDTIREKVDLTKELEKYKLTDQNLEHLQQQYNDLLEERMSLIQEKDKLYRRQGELKAELNAYQTDLTELAAYKKASQKNKDHISALEAKIEQLNNEKETMDREKSQLEARAAILSKEVDSLSKYKEMIAQKGDLTKSLENENAQLKANVKKLTDEKIEMASHLTSTQKKLETIGKFKEMVEKKGDVNKALEEEKKKLEKSLDEARQKIAAIKTAPLKIKTTSFPTTITDEKMEIALSGEGGSFPYTWELNGKLPQGLSFNPVTGVVSGVPKNAGNYKFNIKVTDARGITAKAQKEVPFKVIKKYDEQEKKVSKWFLIMTFISSVLLLYILWGKHKARQHYNQMKAQGYETIIKKIISTGLLMKFLKRMLGLMDKNNLPDTVSGLTDVGQEREANEDCLFISLDKHLFIVADGMGGHNAGEVASREAARALDEYLDETVIQKMTEDETLIAEEMVRGLEYAHRKILDMAAARREFHGMGCTIVAAFIHCDSLYLCHVGDARAYVCDKNEMKLLTIDHSYVMELVKAGKMTMEEARLSPLKNEITQAIGGDLEITPGTNDYLLTNGDALLLCSDGLWDMLTDDEIHDILKQDKPARKICKDLVKAANNAGGDDNITVIVVQYKQEGSERKQT
jgi:protein phosphatase